MIINKLELHRHFLETETTRIQKSSKPVPNLNHERPEVYKTENFSVKKPSGPRTQDISSQKPTAIAAVIESTIIV